MRKLQLVEADTPQLASALRVTRGNRGGVVLVGDTALCLGAEASSIPADLSIRRVRSLTDESAAGADGAVVVIACTDAAQRRRELIASRKLKSSHVVLVGATDSIRTRPAFVNSIPKSGTHLIFECLRAFGFKDPPDLNLPHFANPLAPGHFYNLQHLAMQTLDFQFGNAPGFLTSLCNGVVIFQYRDPRDVAVSMAHYLAQQTDYHLLHIIFREMKPKERLRAVIRGEYPIPVFLNRLLSLHGSIRDLVLLYSNWFQSRLPNVWFSAFEDLVGPRGGSTAEAQQQAIWELQLALQVPGSPAEYANSVFSENALTFRKGQIGGYRQEFDADITNEFNRLPGDFMEMLGYGFRRGDWVREELVENPRFSGTIVVPEERPGKGFNRPIQYGAYAGHNLVSLFRGGENLIIGVPQTIGQFDLTSPGALDHPELILANSLTELRELIAQRQGLGPRLLGSLDEGWNVVEYAGVFYGVPQSAGPIDIANADSRESAGLVCRDSLVELADAMPVSDESRQAVHHFQA